MNNDSQGINLGNPNNVIGPDMSSNNNEVGGVATPNAANGPVIPVVPIVDGSTTQPADNNTAASAGISTPNIITDSSNIVNNSNMNVSENINSVNTASDTVSAINNGDTNNGGIITVSNDSLVASVPPVSATITSETNANSNENVAGASTTLNFELPNNDTPSATPVANSINDTSNSINSTGAEANNSPAANNGVLPVSFNSILSDQATTNQSGTITQVTTPEVTATNNTVTPIDNAVVSQPSISASNENVGVVSLGKYLGHMFLFIIPVVGFILLIVKAFDKKDKSISNFAKAYLLFGVIMTIVFAVISFLMFSLGLFAMNNSDSATQVADTYLYE